MITTMNPPIPTTVMPDNPPQTVPEAELLSPLQYTNEALYCRQVMDSNLDLQQTDSGLDAGSEDGQDKVYTPLSGHRSPHSPAIFTDHIDINSWKVRHPKNWESQDIVHWILYVGAKSPKLDRYRLRVENFNDLTGEKLCRMSRQDFVDCEPDIGEHLYECFINHIRTAQFKAPECIDSICIEDLGTDFFSRVPSTMWSEGALLDAKEETMDLSDVCTLPLANVTTVNIEKHTYEFSPADEFDDIQTMEHGDTGYSSDDSGRGSMHNTPPRAHNNYHTTSFPPAMTPSGHFPIIEEPMSTPPVSMLGHYPLSHQMQQQQQQQQQHSPEQAYNSHQLSHNSTHPIAKQRGRPPKNSTNAQRGRKPGQTTKQGKHLWEFIRDIIHDSRYNPIFIRWENKESGIFKIVNSGETARLWGERKNNPTMTYEKFSRAMRFCREQGVFAHVPKEGYPKKLCFRFGDKADWEQ